MFDNNQPPVSPPEGQNSSDPAAAPSIPASNSPSTVTPPAVQDGIKQEKKLSQKNNSSQSEPEDIFSNSEPAKSSAPQTTPEIKSKASLPDNQPVEQDEPSLKAVHTPFIKKTATKETTQSPQINPTPNVPGSPPIIPKTTSGMDKKNLIIFIILIILVISTVVAGIWWFVNRKKTSTTDINPAVINLFKNSDSNKKIDSNNPEKEQETNNNSKNKQTDADADGDGLSDQEEAALGTSINAVDTDNDGLYDYEEVKTYQTDPLKADTDSDGWKDGEEIQKKQDPLTPDPGPTPTNYYQSLKYKFSFVHPEEMVLESSVNNIVQFNDNFNQIKLFIYVSVSHPELPTPDIKYKIAEKKGKLIIVDSPKNIDQTPYSTEYQTNIYRASNDKTYFIYYIATKKDELHQEKFEAILNSFEFLR